MSKKIKKQIYAVVRLRGSININKKVKTSLNMLNLKRVNHCILIPKNKENNGILKKIKSFITYGEISNETLEKLIRKRGRKVGDKRLKDKEIEKVLKSIIETGSLKGTILKPVLRLSPPSGGFKSIKKDYPKGDLGYRGEKINELLEKMM